MLPPTKISRSFGHSKSQRSAHQRAGVSLGYFIRNSHQATLDQPHKLACRHTILVHQPALDGTDQRIGIKIDIKGKVLILSKKFPQVVVQDDNRNPTKMLGKTVLLVDAQRLAVEVAVDIKILADILGKLPPRLVVLFWQLR